MKEKESSDEHNKKKDGNGMGSRGVTRPMAEMGMKKNHNSGDHDHSEKGNHEHMMTEDQRKEMLHMHHMQTLWIYWMFIILGFWMLISPATFDYGKNPVEPSGGREVWLSMAERISFMKWSDIMSGLLLIFFGWRSLTPNRPVSMWIVCFIGIWISMAPLIFWSPSAAAYLNGTLVGALVIALSILIPGMPNMIMYMKMGPQVPSGWSYNPSSWPQRWIMIVLAFAGWLVSRYLGAFQLGYIDYAWDPFFGNSSMQVLNSNMSHSLPISDGGLGALAYTFEFLMGFMGSPSRWRTMPWMVAIFGILVIPLGLVHIFLVISQPVMVGEWCTMCLLAAAIMLPMIPLEADEVVAMGQFMVQKKRQGKKLWKIFWKGGNDENGTNDDRSPQLIKLPQQPNNVYKASIWGMSFPWQLSLSAVIGLWLMFSPSIFGLQIQTIPANIYHLTGALIIVVSIICMGEVLRMGRYLNILLGLIIAGGLWFTGESNIMANINGLVAGIIIILLAIPQGPKTEQYGLWDKYVK